MCYLFNQLRVKLGSQLSALITGLVFSRAFQSARFTALARRRVFSRANHHLQVLASSSNEFMFGCNKVRVFLQISLTVDDIKRKLHERFSPFKYF